MPFVPHTPEETAKMLEFIGIKSMDDLFADIPENMRPKSFSLPEGLSEFEVCQKLEEISTVNRPPKLSFIGAGFYDHSIPKAVDALSTRGEFLTAYTPYQAEAAQGTLQAIFEYQTAVCRLLDMDVSNASVYDGGSAIFEAAMMAVRATKRKKLLLCESLNPLYRQMLSTLTLNLGLELVIIGQNNGLTQVEAFLAAIDKDTAAVIVQNPSFFGNVTDYSNVFAAAKANGSISIISVYPVLQAVLKTPREMGADIAVADGQSVGQPLSFGGPYLGIMSCTKELLRQLPGRIAGRTNDLNGKIGYVLTLQAREQHIRRAKATSNICSNQALCALRTLIHLSLLGPEGLTRTAEISIEHAHYAADKLTSLPGIKLLNDAPFGNEFAIRLPKEAAPLYSLLIKQGIAPGALPGKWYKNMDDVLLIACTEKNSKEQIDTLVKALEGAI